MLEGLTSLVKSKEAKQVVVVLGAAVLVMTAVHYYHQIKLTRMNIREMKKRQIGN